MRNTAPPAFAEELLRRLLHRRDAEAVLGDLEETYRARCGTVSNKSGARWWYRREAMFLVFHALVDDGTRAGRRKNVNERRWWVSGMVTVALNVVAVAAFWLAGLGLFRMARQIDAGWEMAAVAQVVTCAAGLAIAFRLRAWLCLYFAAGQLAFSLAEAAIHAIYGIRAAQGAPTHFAVMLAATLGVAFGLFIGRRPEHEPATPAGETVHDAAQSRAA